MPGLAQGEQQQCAEDPSSSPLQLSLYVRWTSPSGSSKVNRLLLRPVTSVEALQVLQHAACPVLDPGPGGMGGCAPLLHKSHAQLHLLCCNGRGLAGIPLVSAFMAHGSPNGGGF